MIERYGAAKNRRGLLDYEDLIDKALALFRKTSAAWVLYKLDLGIDHVLVDEAQDTSRKQWEIIKTIVTEFAPGGSRENTRRTVFPVGDYHKGGGSYGQDVNLPIPIEEKNNPNGGTCTDRSA